MTQAVYAFFMVVPRLPWRDGHLAMQSSPASTVAKAVYRDDRMQMASTNQAPEARLEGSPR